MKFELGMTIYGVLSSCTDCQEFCIECHKDRHYYVKEYIVDNIELSTASKTRCFVFDKINEFCFFEDMYGITWFTNKEDAMNYISDLK